MDTITINASLVNPNDPTEVNVVAAVATVGKTNRLSTGQIIKWTPEFLRANAHTFVGKPVNIRLETIKATDAKGSLRKKATGHSRFVVGAIKEAYYDEVKQAVIVTASLWEHYDPETIKSIRELYASGELQVSMEFKYPKDTLIDNADGSQTPTVGTFSGMGFVGQAGDPRSFVYLMAALEKAEEEKQETSVNEVIKEVVARLTGTYKEPRDGDDEAQAQDAINEELSAAHEGSFEWLARNLQEHLSANRSMSEPTYHYVIATYPNYAIYQEGADYFRIDYKRSGDKVNFGEPQEVDPVYQPTASASAEEGGVDPAENTGTLIQGEEELMSEKTQEELQAAQAQNAELKASLDAMSSKLDEMKAALEARDAADAAREAAEQANTKATERLAELEKIVPVKDELKAGLLENLKAVDDVAYEAIKASFAASAELRAGIAPGEGIENPDPTPGKDSQKISDAEKAQFAKEAQAQFGTAPKSGDGE
jgi:hypothetical protein